MKLPSSFVGLDVVGRKVYLSHFRPEQSSGSRVDGDIWVLLRVIIFSGKLGSAILNRL